mgnify:CR=1 FL=1
MTEPADPGRAVEDEQVRSLVKAAKAGDEDAFRRLVELKRDKVYRVAYHHLGRPDDARQVAQAVFVRLWRHLDRYDEARPFDTWLYPVTANAAIDHHRRQKVRAPERPLDEDRPTAFDAAARGPRSVAWRADAPATLVWAEALDGGDPSQKVAKRDKVVLLDAPFTGSPRTLAELELRYAGVTWGGANTVVNERWWRTRTTRSWIVNPSAPAAARKLFDYSYQDRYADPGRLLTVQNAWGRAGLLTSRDGRFAYLVGDGASPQGDRPFLDRLELSTGKTTRLFQSQAPYYEDVVALLDQDGNRIVTRRESQTEAPNYWARDLKTRRAPMQLTRFTDPAPQFAGVTRRMIRYKRADGVDLSATLYLPAGYDSSKGPLPFLFWAYPTEFVSAAAAAQVRGSPYRFARPTGAIPNGTGTQYPNFVNSGTTQPKLDARVDYDQPEYKLVFAGGYSGTDGIFHTGIGPFDGDGIGVGYGTMRYSRGGLKFNVFTNQLNGDALGLLAIGTNGRPIPFQFNTRTYDVEIGNVNAIGTKNVLSYGGNVRYNSFDLSIAPRGDSRTELGFYVQDEIFMHDKIRLNLGARVDKFDNIEDPVFSPRATLILKPHADHAVRVSYNKAFRSPSLINNFLETTIINQLDLAQINAAFAGLPGRAFAFPVRAIGNENLTEESTQSYEVGYTGTINNRATVSAAVYFTKNSDEIFFTQVGRYRALAPPPNWLATFSPGGTPILPVQNILGILEVLPPPCPSPTAACTTGGLPSEFSYRNLGTVKNKGFELGIDGAVSQGLNLFANYSYQAEPEPDFALSEINLPPTNRFNAGFNFSQGMFLGNASVSFVDDAFFQDVLDARFAGPTQSYTQVNGAFGLKFLRDKVTATIKVINLLDEDIQSHVFGDFLKRQVIGELRFQF